MSKKIYKLKSDKPKINFKIDYAGELNDEQYKVIKNAEGPCLVLAGAGSGKTRTLVYRLAYLLEQGVKPKNILLMTFTNKAAREMIWRTEKLLGFKPKGLWAGTFHHIGNRILRQYIKHLSYNSNYSIIDNEDAKNLLKEIIRNKKGYKNFPKANVIKNIISFSINSGKNIETVFTEKFSYLDTELIEPIKNINNIYKNRKKEADLLDYDDLLFLWLKLLKKFPDVKKYLSNKFQYILVDEYQDTNHIQANIVEYLATTHKNILVVGDDAQSIYSFRAADISNILTFPKKFTDTQIFKLKTNYRSTPEILELANNSIKNNINQFPKKLSSVIDSGEKPILIPTQNNEQQAEFISQKIIELTKERYDLKDIAVLFRADFHALELELELNKKSIPYIKRGGIKFFEQAHLKDVISFLKIIYNPKDEIAWTRILNLQKGIGRIGSQKIISAIKNLELNKIITIKNQFPASLKKSWQELLKILIPLEETDKNNIGALLDIVLKQFYINFVNLNFENSPKRLEDIEQLINFTHNYDSLKKFLSDTTLTEDFQAERVTPTAANPEDYLILSTIHQAKGLEWKTVFVINLTSGQFPHAKSIEFEKEIEEERRLFYVACTRAKKFLYLTYPLINYSQTYGFIFSKPSEFLQELDGNLYSEWQLENDSVSEDTIEYLPEV